MKILLIEDDENISSLVKNHLIENKYEVISFKNAEEGYLHFLNNSVNLIILDIMLPGMDGIQLLKKIRNHNSSCLIVLLSAKQSVNDRILGFEEGADDYLVKPFSISELLLRIQALIRRNHVVEKVKFLRYEDLVLDLEKKIATRSDIVLSLHPKELILLELFLRNPEKVLSKELILEKVWGYDFDPQTNVVDVLVCRLRNKLDLEGQSKLLHTQRGVGYVIRKN